MNITAITIENFKGIRDPARIELRPVTLLFGANSAGKSTVVQALHYAHEILERHNLDPGKTLIGGEAIELGGFESVVHKRQRGRPLRIRLELEYDSGDDLPDYSRHYRHSSDMDVSIIERLNTSWIDLIVSWSELLEKPILEKYEVGHEGVLFAALEAARDLRSVTASYLNLVHPIFVPRPVDREPDSELWNAALLVINDNRFDDSLESVSFGLLNQTDALPNWGTVLEIQSEAIKEGMEGQVNFDVRPPLREFAETISRLIVGPGEVARACLGSLRYVGPLRQVPPRNFEAMRSPDEARWASGLAAWDTLVRSDDTLLGKLNQWLSQTARLNAGYRIEVKRFKELDVNSPLLLAIRQRRTFDEDDAVYSEIETAPTRSRVVLRDESSSLEVAPQDVGVGISQLVPVIVAALAKPGIVAIEQPELHIHPAWQVVLGDLFLSQAQEAGAQFLIETHSEHLVLRVMRRMRETFTNTTPPGAPKAEPKDVAVYYVEIDQDQTIIREMPLNEAGELIKAWPGGFFEEGLREQIGDAG